MFDLMRDVRHAARRLAPHADVHAGDAAHAGAGDRRQHRDLQRRQQRPPEAAAVPRAGPAGRPLADRAGRRHRGPQRVDRRLRHLSRGVPDAGRRRHLERHARSPSPAWPSRSASMASTPPSACCRCWASSRSSAAPSSERDNEGGSPEVVMLGHGYWQRRFGGDPARRRAPHHGRRHRPRDHRRAAAGLLVHGHDRTISCCRSASTAPRCASPATTSRRSAGCAPASPSRQVERRRRADDRRRAGQVPAARRA